MKTRAVKKPPMSQSTDGTAASPGHTQPWHASPRPVPTPQHEENTKQPPFPASQTCGSRSIPSIHNHRPPPQKPWKHHSQPFQVAGRRGPMRLYHLTTSGLITREAATSEHCVESRRHTGEESALYLQRHHRHSFPPSSIPLSTNTISQRLRGWHSRRAESRRKEKRRRPTDKGKIPSHLSAMFVQCHTGGAMNKGDV